MKLTLWVRPDGELVVTNRKNDHVASFNIDQIAQVTSLLCHLNVEFETREDG